MCSARTAVSRIRRVVAHRRGRLLRRRVRLGLGPSRVGCTRSYVGGSVLRCLLANTCRGVSPGKTAGRIRCVVAHPLSRLSSESSPVRTGFGPEPPSEPDVDSVLEPAVSCCRSRGCSGSAASRYRESALDGAPWPPTRSSRPCGSQPSRVLWGYPSNRTVSVITFDARNHPVHKDRIDVDTLDHSMLSGWTGPSTSSGRGATSRD